MWYVQVLKSKKKKNESTVTIFKNVGVPNDSHAVVFSNCCFSSTVPSQYALKTNNATLSLYFLFFFFFTSTWGLSTQLHQATKSRSQPIHRYSNFFFPIAMLLIFLFQSLWFYALFIFSQVIFIMVHIWNPILLLLKPNFALFSL